MNRELPKKLLSSINDKSSQESFKIKHHKFHMNITDKWIERWREFDDDFWIDALEKTKCISLMKKLNYEI